MKIQFRGSVLCTLLLVATLTVGCLGGGGVGPSEIEPWSLDGPTLRIGSMDEGPEALTAVRDLAVGPSGNIFVLLPQDHQVRVFDPSGRFIREIGREGRGPGELQRPTALGFLGDTLWVHDPGLGRRSRYTLDGQALGDPSDPRGEPSEERLSVSFAEPLADGAGLFLTAPAFRSEWEGTDHPCPILVLPPGSEGPDTVAFRSLAHDRALTVDQAGGRIVSVMITSQPFSDETLWDLTKDGTSLVLVDRIVADADGPTTFRLSRVTLRGDTSFSKGIPYEPVPVSAPHLDSVVRRAFGGGTAVKEADARKVLFLPKYYPPVSRLVAGDDGTIWIAREQRLDRRVRWEVYGPDGAPLGRLEVPPGLTVYAADHTRLLGVDTDDLDVPYVVRYDVVSDPTAP